MKYIYYTSGTNSAVVFGSGNYRYGQTFLTGGTFTITSVKLKLYREGTPGILTVSIRATENGTPVGDDLTSGTIDGTTITDDSDGEWYEISVSDYDLEANTTYTLVLIGGDGDIDNTVKFFYNSAGTYAYGSLWQLYEGEWLDTETSDAVFEIWGSPIVPPTYKTGQKELRTDWPNTSGLTAGSTKQTGHKEKLVPTNGSLVPSRFKRGI